MPSLILIRMRLIVRLIRATALSLLFVASVNAQSIDVRFPTAVRTNEIVGTIAARDIGDSRLTDHFYTFNGAPGDLLITVESKNLNGDLDIFTASELRPLLKVTVYAESVSPVAKSIYLRKPESLILRVEARSPNDDEGSYRIRFAGSFEPITTAPLADESGAAEPNQPEARSTDRKVTRVSSAGARIDEPLTEVAAAPTPTPEEVEALKPAPKSTPRRGRVPARRTPTKPAAETAKKSTSEKSGASKQGSDTEKKAEPEKKETPTTTSETPKAADTTESKPRPVRKNTTRRTPKTTPATKPAAEPAPESGPRLVIEVKDGTRIEFFMSRVRRVTVENGWVVVVSTNGKMEQIAMADVVRMSIGP